jgi:hypothetical protein
VNWVQVRLLWVGFYKSSPADECNIATMPKELVRMISDWYKAGLGIF